MAHIVGTDGSETLEGTAEADRIEGLAGKDRLLAGGGDDILIGGAGADYLHGQGGSDTASYESALIGLTLNLADAGQSTGDAAGDRFVSIERYRLTAFDDTFIGSSGADHVDGGAGNDTLRGGAGNDLLIGGAGADLLDGGEGEDWAIYATSSAGATINLMTPAGSTGDAAGDAYVDIEGIEGSAFGDTITLKLQNATIRQVDGGAGDDTITGSVGSDIIWGGAGNDTIYAMGGNDIVYVASRNGKADAADSFNRVFGDYGNDQIFGSDGVDELWGGPGSDLLEGGRGDDFLYGDSLDAPTNGGGSNDTLRGGAGNDLLVGSTGADILDGGAGYDVSVYLAPVTIDFLDPANTTGEARGDTLISIEELRFLGRNQTNYYIGGTGSYTVTASGDDAIFFAGSGVEHFRRDAGTMEVNYSNSAKAVKLVASGDRLVGSIGARGDTIVGATGLVLTSRADTVDLSGLTGPVGRIELRSGAGADRLTLSGLMDNAFVLAGDGNDVIDGATNGGYVAAEVGNDTVTLAAAWGQSTYIDGGAGNDTITLLQGMAVIHGGAGNDVIVATGHANVDGGSGNDTISFLASGIPYLTAKADGGAGSDAISVRDYLNAEIGAGAGADTIVVHDTFGVDLRGDSGDDVIDVFNAAGGLTQGTISGGSGNDIIIARSLSRASVHGDDGDDTITVSGERLNITGGKGHDTIALTVLMSDEHGTMLDGGAGNDTISVDVDAASWQGREGGRVYVSVEGGLGNDTIVGFDHRAWFGNSLNEDFIFGPRWGHDVISGFDSYRDKLVFKDMAAQGLTSFSQLDITGDENATHIAYGNNSITLLGFDVADVNEYDFWFYS